MKRPYFYSLQHGFMLYNILLFLITFGGGTIPLWTRSLGDKQMHLLLAFSGSFLLSITFLHLLPETFEELNAQAGFLLLGGFFLQLLIQRYTHGVEHGHVHVHPGHNEHHIPLASILTGLSVHAFMEGLPLGFNYRMGATAPSLYMAVAAHKIPEAMLAAMLVSATNGRAKALSVLFWFSAITPISSILATMLGHKYYFMSQAIIVLIPVVAGAFIHISTTIFFESGTKQHMITWQKIIAMIIGVGIGLATLLFE